MNYKGERFYLVREDVLSEAMTKTLEAKMLLETGKVNTINEAVKAVDLSRSAFYKYRDRIFPFETMVQKKIVSISIHLEDRSGSLSSLLGILAELGCNILTIHQTIPLQGRANITMSIETASSKEDINGILKSLEKLEHVRQVNIIGSGA
ncbi:ACT domain-containing protein [Pseudalkalibacillus salsuginis]|uniref:ACT domain-containing protein n=1 Tax=Pseudalkalibacillus salsuginis TaxID=2910972 RepID=UPI001F31771A|nr:ACT domain-containing protein [Pseudalkalibacillus salsuginis]MCF6408650.1 ACT domain-containing protein [Pseudalkalibacillus salsuginis]